MAGRVKLGTPASSAQARPRMEGATGVPLQPSAADSPSKPAVEAAEADLLSLVATSPTAASPAPAPAADSIDLLTMFSPPADATSTNTNSVTKPSMRIELDPEAVSDAAIMSALGGGDASSTEGAAGSDLPIDAQDDAGALPLSSTSASSSPSNDILRASLGITTLDPEMFARSAGDVDESPTPGSSAPAGDASDQLQESAEPVCLVAQDGAELCVAPEGMALLQSLGSATVAVITVAGNYRTGKSFFLNQLAGVKPRKHNPACTKSRDGFRVGHDTESCTRGIWVWLVPTDVWSHPTDPSVRLLLMDTEGLASIDQDETWDAKVFSLGILLSSMFVYNNMGVIDEGAIDRLFLVGELTKNICVSANPPLGEPRAEQDAQNMNSTAPAQTESELAEFFPPFVWLLRDFSLHMKKDGELISHSQYLEQALANRDGKSSRIAAGNRIRTSFRTLFRDRQCRTLVRPAVDEESLRNLATLDQSQLRPEFVEEMAKIRQNLLGRVEPKELYGKQVTAAMLGALTKAYTDAINAGGVPDIKKSWGYVVEETMRQAHDSALTKLRDGLQALSVQGASGGKLPTDRLLSTTDFAQAAHSLHAAAHDEFSNQCGGIGSSAESQQWRTSLDDAFGIIYDQAYQQLLNVSTIACTDILQPLVLNTLEDPIAQGRFDSADSKGATAAATMGTAVLDELLVQYEQQAHGPATASIIASTLVARLPALYTNLARRVDDMASQAIALAENAATTERRQAETLREALNASIQAEALVSARLETLEKSLEELQKQTEVRSNSISLSSSQ